MKIDPKKAVHAFSVDAQPILKQFGLTDEDFADATKEERESVVTRHKSVSYWRDAWRRFRKNTVSMVALFVFILMLLFAFVGPTLIPYDYEAQYRYSANCGALGYSPLEHLALGHNEKVKAIWTPILQSETQAIRKGNYYINYDGVTYAFRLETALEKAVIVAMPDEPDVLYYIVLEKVDENGKVMDGDLREGGEIAAYTPLKEFRAGKKNQIKITFTDEPAEGAAEIVLSSTAEVFPHFFGTDSYGRDLMARTMYGARVSIIIGIAAALIVLVIGSIYGAVSGLAGGAVDFIMMRLIELIYSIPEVLIVLLLQVVLKDPLQAWFDAGVTPLARAMGDLGSGIVSIFITFALLYWVTMARIVRGQVLQLKKQEYVTAATALGASNGRIIRRHLLPNAVGALVITTCLQIPSAIFLESFLSFLGLGVSAPMASLGSLCSDALSDLIAGTHVERMIFPAITLVIIVLSLNLIGDGLRDALDPRLKK